jgi:hypothetical protein
MTYNVFVTKMIGEIAIRYNDHTTIEQVEIVYRSTKSQIMDKVSVISPFLPVFKSEKMADLPTVTELIKRWFDLRAKISAVYDLYFGVMYNHELYLTIKFLMLAQALEIYVEIKLKGDDSITEKRRQITALVEELNKSNLSTRSKKWISEVMNEKKSLSFKEKAIYIYEQYAELLPNLSNVIGTKDEFSSRVKSFRNNFTHRNIDYDQQDNEQIFWACKDIQLILQLSILSELGFSIVELKKIYLVS